MAKLRFSISKYLLLFSILSITHIHCDGSSYVEGIPEIPIILEPLFIDSNVDKPILASPFRISIDSKRNIYILDPWDQRIAKFSSTGEFIKYIGRRGEGPGEFYAALHFAIDNNNETIYVHDAGLRRVSRFTTSGIFINSFMYTGPRASSIAVKSDGTIALHQPQLNKPLIYFYNQDGEKIDSIGMTIAVATEWYPEPTAESVAEENAARIMFNENDELIVIYFRKHTVERYSTNGILLMETSIQGEEIELLHQKRREHLRQIERRRGSLRGVYSFSYFYGADLINNEKVALNIAWQSQTLYIIDESGDIVKKYRYKPPKPYTTASLNIRDIVVTKDNTFLGIDGDNLVIWSGVLQ